MKFIAVALALLTFGAQAASVTSVRLDAARENILVDVSYGGGCKKHTFDLKMGACLESLPVQCTAKLVEKVEGGFDGCEALIHTTAVFNIKKLGLYGDYFSGGTLIITGDKNWEGKASSGKITLP